MKRRVVLKPHPETNEWAIWCPELPRCNPAVYLKKKPFKNIQEAIEVYLQPDPLKLPPDIIILPKIHR
jgi:predicted RNase H-like HicB family nuclease